jgi:protein-S-isoprenylcysteine O-methyltransferase Ste14
MSLGYAVHYIFPWDIGNFTGIHLVGIGIVIMGLIIVIFTFRSFKKAETHIEPWKPTTKIISTGIFARSRNPIYGSFCVISIGIGLILNSYWILLSFIPSAIMVYVIAIKKEEAYLEKKFGEEYMQYKKKVRRWV